MSTQHIVNAAAIKVSIGGQGGNRVAAFLTRGSVVPEGIVEEQLERLVARGLVRVEETEDETGVIDEGPYKGVSVKDLKAEIEKRNEGRGEGDKVAPAEPSNRPQIVAALIADDTKE